MSTHRSPLTPRSFVPRPRSPFPRLRAGFSLIELLVVIGIIGLVAAFAVPAASTIIMGTELTRGSQVLSNVFSQARQAAVTRNHTIELRLIKYADPDVPAETVNDPKTWKYRCVQLLEILPNGAKVALLKPERLPGSVQMNDGPYSSLINSAGEANSGQIALTVIDASSNANSSNSASSGTTSTNTSGNARVAIGDTQPEIPGVQRNYQYVAFHFMPDGSTDLKPSGRWYVTILTGPDQMKLNAIAQAGGGASGGGQADPIQSVNYFTVQVDPVSGATRTFRPTIATAAAPKSSG